MLLRQSVRLLREGIGCDTSILGFNRAVWSTFVIPTLAIHFRVYSCGLYEEVFCGGHDIFLRK